jgi:hypothetical protein
MDTQELVTEAKLRFSHNSAKQYLYEKYTNKLTIAEQNGLWRADTQTISFLNSFNTKSLILIDTFDNPVQVNRLELLKKLTETYQIVMQEYFIEYKKLEDNR